MIYIRFSHNQVGMFIEASRDKQTWHPVQLQKYTDFPAPTYGWGSGHTVMSTERQEKAYLASLDMKGIKYEVTR